MPTPALSILSSHASIAGLRVQNEDFLGMVTPTGPELSCKGLIAALADGVSGSEGGRAAAEYTVRGLLTDYYATPDTWEISTAFDKVLGAINSWVQHQGSSQRETAGMATTLTGLVLRGRSYYSAHVGDSRAYLWRDQKLRRLTQDHVWDRPEMQHVLTRAIGLDRHLNLDHGMGELVVGDVFVLVSDGFWSACSDRELSTFLAREIDAALPDELADRLCQLALAGGSQDNISVLLLQVTGLPEGDLRDTLGELGELPVPPLLQAGGSIDGLIVEEILHSSATTLLYRVCDPIRQRQLVLKTLQPERGNDALERRAFMHEAWLARRVVARFFPQVINPLQRSALYYLSTWHPGASLQQKLDNDTYFTVPELLVLGSRLARAVGALHRRQILHRDIKPANVHLGDDGELRLLDLGVAQSGWDRSGHTGGPLTMAGTPSFLAPEQFNGGGASEQTDLYALGVTLYYSLTRHYPYGEIEAFQHPRFQEPVRPGRYRPELPQWLETLLLKAVARDPADRFETAEELLLALERGASHPLRETAYPLLKRNPVLVWRSLAIASLVLNLLFFYWLAVS